MVTRMVPKKTKLKSALGGVAPQASLPAPPTATDAAPAVAAAALGRAGPPTQAKPPLVGGSSVHEATSVGTLADFPIVGIGASAGGL